MRSNRSSAGASSPAALPGVFDAWFLAQPAELALMRHALRDWLVQECVLEEHRVADMLIAAHEAGVELAEQRNPRIPELDGFAVRAEYDGRELTVTLVATNDVCAPPLQDPRKWTTQLVLGLVDEAEVESRDDAAQVSLRRELSLPPG